MFRESCGDCHFCNTIRPSDITLADFWGWEKQDPTFNIDNKGVNLLLINTEKGRRLFEAIKPNLEVIIASPNAYLQPNLRKPSKIHKNRKLTKPLYQYTTVNHIEDLVCDNIMHVSRINELNDNFI